MTDLQDAAAWLVRAGYTYDWDTTEAPPAAFREAIIDAVHADPTGRLHGNELSRDEIVALLAETARGFSLNTQETTR
ncbi:hypothetical protein [Streptomyces sp. 8L]|uniref:hypothetical protein n=1 Tax=Streptomyces sp. 8L TaxID=2877242 RepID=UPI001CD7A99B|nr:hypothetical protein [Streptomyces sp. 8L]MCA1222442.1 hypothetical protein [Streptomyces sp. 8L]